MSCGSWHQSITPKVAGTWNIHNAVQARGHALDFFLMTSSISGSVGVATESNYCASNHFLDSFARYRRNLGLPAVAVGLGMISEVGYLHENPDKEALLVRKGLQSINEDEFLQIIDAVLAPSYGSSADNYDTLSESHILTGLEPLGLNELRKKGFEGTLAALNDPRASLLAGALAGEDMQYYSSSSQWRLPAELTAALRAGDTVSDFVLRLVVKKLSDFLLVPIDKMDISKPMASYGIDSMLAAVIRTWFYQTFQVDIAFMTLLSQSTTIRDLALIASAEVALTQSP